MALTVMSSAGVITASAATTYVKPTTTVTITQDGQTVDPTQPVQLGVPVTIRFSWVNNDPTLTLSLDIAGTVKQPPDSHPGFSYPSGGDYDNILPGGECWRGFTFTPDVSGVYCVDVSRNILNFKDATGHVVATTEILPLSGSVFAAPTKDSALTGLSELRAMVDWYSGSAFHPAGTKAAMLSKVDDATLQAEADQYGAAATILKKTFIPRTDGFALRGTSDKTDNIRDRPSFHCYVYATAVVNELSWLQAQPPVS